MGDSSTARRPLPDVQWHLLLPEQVDPRGLSLHINSSSPRSSMIAKAGDRPHAPPLPGGLKSLLRASKSSLTCRRSPDSVPSCQVSRRMSSLYAILRFGSRLVSYPSIAGLVELLFSLPLHVQQTTRRGLVIFDWRIRRHATCAPSVHRDSRVGVAQLAPGSLGAFSNQSLTSPSPTRWGWHAHKKRGHRCQAHDLCLSLQEKRGRRGRTVRLLR